MYDIIPSIWNVLLEAAPWLLIGLLVAGLIKALIPADAIGRWLGGRGTGAVVRAALVGTPLPLCSCSVLPAALAIRRAGASRGATVSFLVATPENGVDSILLSYALLGPFMTVARPVAALFGAVFAGIATNFVDSDGDPPGDATGVTGCHDGAPETSACHDTAPSCCAAAAPDTNVATCASDAAPTAAPSLPRRVAEGLRYAVTDLYRDIVVWLAIGIVLAGVVNALVPPGTIAAWGSGLPAMIAMLLIGIPMYICATASTPVASALLLAGVSPGTVLVFLLAGPATNIASFGIVRRELGGRAAGCYLAAIAVGSVVMGLAADACANAFNIEVAAETPGHAHLFPHAVALGAVVILALMTLRLVLKHWTVRVSASEAPCHEPG